MASKPKLVVLRRSADFAHLAKKGRKVHTKRWLTVNFLNNGTTEARVGWTIPRQVGKAVLRNRLRRWCREILRPQIDNFSGFDINVFIRPNGTGFYSELTFEEFSTALNDTLSLIRKRS